MKKEEICNIIYDTTIPYHELPDKVPIEDFVGRGNVDTDKKITYGVNVSLGGEIDIPVIPFNYNSIGFDAKRIAEKVTSGYTIPDFLNQFNLQEILFRVDFIKESSKIKINKILIKKQIGKKSLTSDEIKSDFFDKNPSTFLHENILALFHSHYSSLEVKVNVWVRGVDPDVTTGNFLEHFLVISDDLNIYDKSIKPTIAQNFLELVIILKSRLLYDAKIKQRKEAIKSAKAAIMARNMSHNLGSHVMSYLKVHLGSVSNILRDHVLSTLLESENLDSLKNLSINSNKLTLPFLVGLGRFISYLQERQDYIATVSTDHIPYCSSVNFKDFIYDELNSDKRYERHLDRTNLKPDNILLGNIARSEGLGRQTSPTKTQASQTEGESSLRDIVLKFRTSFDGSPVPEIKPNDKNTNNPKLIAARELEEMRQYELSLPGGIVGRQAIFSLVENIIRNAAKHGNWREQGKLELTIDIFTKEDVEIDQPNNDLKKRLLDNDKPDGDSLSLKGVLKKFYCGKGSNDYYIITLTDNLDSDPKLLEELRKALYEDYVNHENRMIETNKGIKEMRISAAWLRRSFDNDMELSPFNESTDQSNWDKHPPILYVRLSKDIHNQCHLQYIFCVLRPKKVAFVSSSFANQNQNTNNLGGYYFLSPDEYIDVPNKNFEFVVYDDEILNTYENNSKKDLSKPESDIKNPPNTNIYTGLFAIEKKRYVKARCQSSQRFIILSNLLKEKSVIEEIKTLVLEINGIKNQIENINKRIEELTEEVYKRLIKTLNERLTEKTEELKRETEEAYFHLYKHLSEWDEKEKILIDDNSQINSLSDEEKKSKLDNVQASAHDNIDECNNKIENPLSSEKLTYNPADKNIKYRYIKHLEEKVEFNKYVLQNDTQYDFSEGITGDNSTDRLVRKEPKTELWFFKQLHAMKQQVAVIDERIFTKVTGLDESDFVSREASWSKDLDADKESLKAQNKLSEDIIDEIDMFDTHEDLEEYIVNMNLKKPDIKIIDNLNSVDAHNHLGATYKYKNLHVFSIIRSIKKPKCFNLYGISINNDKKYFSECVRFATISWNSDKKQLIIENDAKQKTDWMKFHSLSIHQGLLDKMYDAFGIKKDDIVAKENLTKVFYEHFIIDAPAQEIEFMDEKKPNQLHYFLPGMTIHSGRSKPSKEDMPQQLPFIPYSAIEHAVLDCKYSIVELLDSARYE